MALNSRQREHIERAQKCAKMGNELFALCNQVKESHAEEFDTGQDNEILTSDIENEYNITFAKLDAAIQQFCTKYCSFWDNEVVTQREYGKDARAIISFSININKIF